MESPNGVNIVVVVIDTLRYDHISTLPAADGTVETPNFDNFAESSWRFTNAYSSSFPTIPNRVDLLTGRHGGPFHRWTPLPYDRRTLPESLSDVGYVTQLIHDTPHLVNDGHRFDKPFHAWTPIRGAEVDRPRITDNWEWLDNWALDDRFDGYDISPKSLFSNDHVLPRYVQANRGRNNDQDWNVARLFSTAAEFLEDNSDRENFFLWIDCFDPHEPWDAPPEYIRKYDPAGDGFIDPRSFSSTVRKDPDLDPKLGNHLESQYKAKVTFLDSCFGKFLQTLENTGLNENTAIVVLSDHGCNLGDHHGRQYGKEKPPLENEAHVPLLLNAPDHGCGTSEAMVQPQDLFRTVANLAGAEVPRKVDSRDLLSIATNDGNPRDIALTGSDTSHWQNSDADDILFSAYDGDWCLGVTPAKERAKLWRSGEHTEVANSNTEIVEDLYDRAVAEIERRGLNPKLARWLRRGGGPFPEEATTSNSPDRPEGWRSYWDPQFYR